MLARLGIDGLQGGSGLGGSGQDPLDSGEGKCAVTAGALQGRTEILLAVCGQQSQDPLRFVLAEAPCADELVEEDSGFASEFFKTLAEQFLFAPEVWAGQMIFVDALLAAGMERQQFMPGNLGDVGTIDDQLIFRNAHGQELADTLPGNRVEVLPVADGAFAVDCSIYYFCPVLLFF